MEIHPSIRERTKRTHRIGWDSGVAKAPEQRVWTAAIGEVGCRGRNVVHGEGCARSRDDESGGRNRVFGWCCPGARTRSGRVVLCTIDARVADRNKTKQNNPIPVPRTTSVARLASGRYRVVAQGPTETAIAVARFPPPIPSTHSLSDGLPHRSASLLSPRSHRANQAPIVRDCSTIQLLF